MVAERHEAVAAPPRWTAIYDMMKVLEVGDLLSYRDLSQRFPGVSRESLRSDIYIAIKEIEETHKRTFECARGLGYRMVQPNEHLRLARNRHKRARRQVKRAVEITVAVDISMLNLEEQKKAETYEIHSRRLLEAMESVSRRTNRIKVRLEPEDA